MDKNYYWYFGDDSKNRVAIVTENENLITYSQLDSDVKQKMALLPQTRSLVFLSVSNDYDSVVWYLACLRAEHPTLLLEKDLDEILQKQLLEKYKPNLLINHEVINLHSTKYDMHEDLALLMSTSGTTGSPKLVKLSKNNIVSNAHSIAEYLELNKDDVAISTLPMSYSFGLSILNSHLAIGASIVLNENSLMSRDFWNKIERFKVTSFSGVPFIFQMLKKLNYKRFSSSSIRYLTQAGGKLDDETIRYFNSVCNELGQKFYVMYGQTEASPRISYVPFECLEKKIGSIGIPIPFGNLQILDGNQIISSPKTEGELVYSGPNVMMGYAESIIELALGNINKGILHTGDLGYFDEDGYFYITGRAKRFIKLFGLRISLDGIDSWLLSQGVDAVSTGTDDCLIICYSSALDVESLKIKICKEFKLNANFVVFKNVDSIPRKNGGKVDFKLLNEIIKF